MSITNVIIIAVLGLLAYQFIKTKMSISKPDELKSKINNGAFLVDVRSPSEFSAGSAKGAVNIPLDTISSNLSKFENKNDIVVFCRSGNRSAQAKSILKSKGFTNIVNGGTWENVNKLV